jgi:hypothetical protein
MADGQQNQDYCGKPRLSQRLNPGAWLCALYRINLAHRNDVLSVNHL